MAKKSPEEKTKKSVEKKITSKDIEELFLKHGLYKNLDEEQKKLIDEVMNKARGEGFSEKALKKINELLEKKGLPKYDPKEPALVREKLPSEGTGIKLPDFPTGSWETFSADEKRYQIKQVTKNFLILGNAFLEAASWGDDREIRVFIEEGFPVAYQDPQTGSTALHKAAASQARDVIKVLIGTGKCDFLLRDNQGRLSSEMAYLYGHDPALARLLGNKERKQGEAQGIKLTRRPPSKPEP